MIDEEEEFNNILISISELQELPKIIKIAKLIYDISESDDDKKLIYELLMKLKEDMIALDVFCQDLEWTLHERNILNEGY